MNARGGRSVTMLMIVAALASCVGAQWPRWGGPTGDFRAASTTSLADRWPESGPRVVWDRALGNGTSAISIDRGVAYTLWSEGKAERVVALDAATGRTRWEHRYAVRYAPSNAANGGPHATPLIVGDLVFTIGIDAKLHAFDRSGKVRWMRDLVAEYRVDLPQFGWAASPLAWGDLLIVPGLGGPAPGAMAFRQSDGSLAWARHAFLSSHASPILIDVEGTEQVVFHGMNRLVGVRPRDGELLWQTRLRDAAVDNVAVTPLWDATRRLFVLSHPYDRIGTRGLRLTVADGRTSVAQVWTNRRLKIEHGNGVLLDGAFYGSDGSSFVTGVTLEDGGLRFKQRGIPKATFLVVGDKLLVLDQDGDLHLARPRKDGLEVLASASVLKTNAWTVPTVVGRRVWLRDRFRIKCLELP